MRQSSRAVFFGEQDHLGGPLVAFTRATGQRCRAGTINPSAACASKAHTGINCSVPTSVPKRGPTTILRQPMPPKFSIKKGLKSSDFRPLL